MVWPLSRSARCLPRVFLIVAHGSSRRRRHELHHRHRTKGTTATKAVVFEAATGRAVASAHRATRSLHPQSGWHEEDMEVTFAGVAGVYPRRNRQRRSHHPAMLRVSAFPAIWAACGLWTATTSRLAQPSPGRTPGRRAWSRNGGRTAWLTRSMPYRAMFPIPGVPLALLPWLKANEPERYRSIGTLLFAKDYINFRLTGRLATE